MEDKVTILECVNDYAVATKTIRANKDGSITKEPYQCGKKFTHREETVHDIRSLGNLIQSQEGKIKEFLIRGEALKTNKSKIVSRCGEGHKEAAFKDVGRRWMMVDIDDLSLPDFIDPTEDPEAAVKWARASLPKPFRKATCYYQFSSGQGVPEKLGEKPKHVLKIHLFFWLNKPVTSQQWRRYINE